MKGNSRTPRHLSVLFPSLSTDILWKPAPASRVRFAAQKPRALDAATAFLHVPPVKKAKGRSSKVSTPAGSIRPRPTSIPDPSTLAYSSQKLVLTMGATVPVPATQITASLGQAPVTYVVNVAGKVQP